MGAGEDSFNTSHVSINRIKSVWYISGFLVSIHLMFLLIYNCPKEQGQNKKVSIHLMFLLIQPRDIIKFVETEFQYISCFY